MTQRGTEVSRQLVNKEDEPSIKQDAQDLAPGAKTGI